VSYYHSNGYSTYHQFDDKHDSFQLDRAALTVIGGKFVALAGVEVLAPTGNTNFSRSLLFFAEPMTHTRVRATYAASDTLSLIAGVNNGWNYASGQAGATCGR
jgi:hypothetical protein